MVKLLSISWHNFLALCVMLLAIVASFYWAVNDDDHDLLKHAKHLEISWTGANGRIEAEKLRASLAYYMLSKNSADRAKITMELAIVKGRLKTWSHGQFDRFVKQNPEHEKLLEQAKMTLHDIETNIKAYDASAAEFVHRDRADEETRILDQAQKLADLIKEVGRSAHEMSIAKAASVRKNLQDFHFFQEWTIRSLLFLGSLLLFVTIMQNRSLKRAGALAKSNAERYSFLAKHDQVTGLANRMAVDEKLHAFSLGDQSERRLCVLAMDLDGFKSVNDTMGHAAGDAALRAVAVQLLDVTKITGYDALVARVGGDEFVILMLVDDPLWSFDAFANLVLARFRHPIQSEFGSVELGMSIGIAECCDGKTCGFGLLMNADLALTDAKQAGKNRIVSYHDNLRSKMKRRETIDHDLKRAIANEQIHLAYQPQFDMGSGTCVGFEALVRWHHPELGDISPAEFIPMAETSGVIVELGEFVLRTACQNAVSWPKDIAISVNLSIAQILREDMVASVRQILQETGLAPERLKLEITETLLISDFGHTAPILKSLQDIGVKISLDDFGTGYSGLSYLTKLSWDEIKIDRSFVVSAQESHESRDIIELIIQMATELGAKVTIEGIETQEQYDLFAQFGCTNAQGYYLGRPSDLNTILYEMKRHFPNFGHGHTHAHGGNGHGAEPAPLRPVDQALVG